MTANAVLGVLVLAAAAAAATAQTPPPVRGTIALEGTTQKVYAAMHIVIVKTIDGVEHVFHFTKDLLVHGGKGSGVDAFPGLEEGRTVVVHYTVAGAEETAQEIDRIGDEGLRTTEGIVTRVDRGRKQLTIKYFDGTSETLSLTNRAAAEAEQGLGQVTGATVVVYYRDEAGNKVVHYFKRTP